MTTTPTPTDSTSPDEIIARPDKWYRLKRLIMVVAVLGIAPWFAYDGWVNYPRENAKAIEEKRLLTEPPHSDLNIALQKIFALSLPVLGVVLLLWTLRSSRGQYRMAGDVVSIPGHPDLPLDSIRAIDELRWQRKGIAYLEYELPSGQKGRAKLDDFIFERVPTDAIYDRIKQQLLPTTPTDADAETAPSPASDA